MLLEGKENIEAVRTRDQEFIDNGDWVVDVGFEYSPERLRFDHHQKGALERENSVQYAAFGLVWKHYGAEVCGSEEVAEKIEKSLVLPIDAGDVGVSIYKMTELEIRPVELFDIIDSYLPPWESDLDMDEQFLKAVDFAYDFLIRKIAKTKAKLAMRAYAEELYESATEKKVLESEKGISTKFFIGTEVQAVISPDSNGSGNWVVSVVPAEENSFEYPVRFPEEWGGLRGDELEKVTGITGAGFCHRAGFIFVGSKEAVTEAVKKLV